MKHYPPIFSFIMSGTYNVCCTSRPHLRFRVHEHSPPCCARAHTHTALPSLLCACTFPV